jgi:transcriptional regulator with XRE-family HTH domain
MSLLKKEVELLDSVRKNIKKYRIERGLTQEQFGEILGKRRGTISKIETNKGTLTDDEIFSIAKVLDISPQAIINDEFDTKNLNSISLESNLSNDNSIIMKSLENIIREIVSQQYTKRG